MGSIFNEKLLKSVICGTINSTRMHYLQLTCQQLRAEQKKKKYKEEEAENVDTQRKHAIQTAPMYVQLIWKGW